MRRFRYFILATVVFLVGFAIGASLSVASRAPDAHTAEEQRLRGTGASHRHGSLRERVFASDEEMLTLIMSAVAEDEPLLRAHRLHDALAQLNSAELAVLFEHTLHVDDQERRGLVLGALIARWVTVDPSAASAAVQPYRTNGRIDWRSLESAVCQAWGAALPERALAEAITAPDAPWARIMAAAAIQSLAEGNPTRQLEALASLPASQLRTQMCETAIKALSGKDSIAAEAHLGLIPSLRQRARVQSEILGKLAARDPTAGLARLAALAPNLVPGADSGGRVVDAILRAAATKDPAAAIAAIDGLPEELQTAARGSALVGWAFKHPIDALTWAAANGVEPSATKAFSYFGDIGLAGWDSLLSVAFQSDRAKTLAWVVAQPASPERDAMLLQGLGQGQTSAETFQIYAELTPKGQAEATTALVPSSFAEGESELKVWIKDQPPGMARENAIRALTTRQANVAPENVDVFVDSSTAAPDRDAALRGVVTTLRSHDPRRALDYARRIRDTSTRQSAFENIAQAWLSRDELAARAWLIGAPELSGEQKRVLLRQFGER